MRKPLTTTLLEWMSTCVRHVGLHEASVSIEVPDALYDAMARETSKPVTWMGQPLDLCVYGPGVVAVVRRRAPEKPVREKPADGGRVERKLYDAAMKAMQEGIRDAFSAMPSEAKQAAQALYGEGGPPVSPWYAGTFGTVGVTRGEMTPPKTKDVPVAVPETRKDETCIGCGCQMLLNPHHNVLACFQYGRQEQADQRARASDAYRVAEDRQVRAQQEANQRGMTQAQALTPPAHSHEERLMREAVAVKLSRIIYPEGHVGFGADGLDVAWVEVERLVRLGQSAKEQRQPVGNGDLAVVARVREETLRDALESMKTTSSGGAAWDAVKRLYDEAMLANTPVPR